MSQDPQGDAGSLGPEGPPGECCDCPLEGLECSDGQYAKYDAVAGEWCCVDGYNIVSVQNSELFGWFNELRLYEADTDFRVTIDKAFDTTPLRIILNDQVGSKFDCRVWGAIEVQIDDGNGYKSISNPGACSQAWYDGYDMSWNVLNLQCLVTDLPAGTYDFRVVYSCRGNCTLNCFLGNYLFLNQDGSVSFQRRLIIEELR